MYKPKHFLRFGGRSSGSENEIKGDKKVINLLHQEGPILLLLDIGEYLSHRKYHNARLANIAKHRMSLTWKQKHRILVWSSKQYMQLFPNEKKKYHE